ncbi:MAG: single-stranded DNA-binding protein [Candidatus Aminicenantes bacterium]|nr:MAG: single-stranded DNA-binding protein [Candidatus Aminicenantes bacterium]
MANKRSLNRVILVGNVGRDPEITHIPNLDRDVAKFSVATTEVFMDKASNQFQDYTEWHNIVAWGYTAKKVERQVSKGSLVLVEGKIKTRKWKDQNDQDRWSTEIRAESVTVLERANKERSMGDTPYSQPTPSAPMGPPEPTGPQAPPEMQIDDMDIPYDDSDPF